MLEIIKDLFNYPRSITGQATRETLKYIAEKSGQEIENNQI